MPKTPFKVFKLEWQPIMKKMENTPGMQLPEKYANINEEVLNSSFILATRYLKENIYSFLFLDKNKRIESWTVGSWSKCTQRNHILKHGNANDIANLPDEKRENRAHVTKRTVSKKVPSTKS